jgi:hypothetical protein
MPEYVNSLEIAQKLLDQQGEINDLRAKVAKVRDIHAEFKIYEECRHAEHDDGADVVVVNELGEVCRSGYQYSICRECCAPGDSQTEDCVDNHDHTECWPCSTWQAVDAPVAEREGEVFAR